MSTDGRPDDEHEHDRLRTALGAYVLGGLSAAEQAEVEQHLAGCDACRAELEELRPVAVALRDARDVTPGAGPTLPDDPPADLGSQVLAAVEAERIAETRRAWVRRAGLAAVAGAAAAVVLVAGIAVTRPVPEPAPTVPLEAVEVEVDTPGITADADLVNHTWGVEVKLHGSGFASGERYRVSVVDDAGDRTAAGAFVGTGSKELDCNLSSAVLRDDAAGFEVRDAAGDLVVVSHFA